MVMHARQGRQACMYNEGGVMVMHAGQGRQACINGGGMELVESERVTKRSKTQCCMLQNTSISVQYQHAPCTWVTNSFAL